MSDAHDLTVFHDGGTIEIDGEFALGEEAAHHARVKRVELGATVRLIDGKGSRAVASLERVGKRELVVRVRDVESVAPLAPVHLLVPVADRDRMLWLAEKSAELALTSWRPVMYRRSRSVLPRGEGRAFAQKVRARMIAALEQSGGAWLPDITADATLEDAIAALGECDRVLLDAAGEPILSSALSSPLALAVGPEGGVEPSEFEMLLSRGFRPARLAGNILRFETAAIAALSIARAALTR